MLDARTVSSERKSTDHVYYSMTKSLCGTCKTAVDAKIVFAGRRGLVRQVLSRRTVTSVCRVSSSVEWYLDALSFIAPQHAAAADQQAGHRRAAPSTAAPVRRISRRSTCRSCRSRRRATSTARSATPSTRTTTRTACPRMSCAKILDASRGGSRRARHHQLHRRRADAAPAAARVPADVPRRRASAG